MSSGSHPLLTAVVAAALTTVPQAFLPSRTQASDADYKLGPDSMPKENVPKGELSEHVWKDSKVFPGTTRRYYVYVPEQYDGSTPAALMVFQDGHAYTAPEGQFRAPVVMDNLIAEGAMPVTIGVFIDPGHLDPLPERPGWKPTPKNRSFEYDTLSADYSRLLLEEILPAVAKDYKITDNPELRAVCGISSGGIAPQLTRMNGRAERGERL